MSMRPPLLFFHSCMHNISGLFSSYFRCFGVLFTRASDAVAYSFSQFMDAQNKYAPSLGRRRHSAMCGFDSRWEHRTGIAITGLTPSDTDIASWIPTSVTCNLKIRQIEAIIHFEFSVFSRPHFRRGQNQRHDHGQRLLLARV